MNCSLCGHLLEPEDKFRAKIIGTVDNPLRTNVGAFAKDIEWIVGSFRHLDCQHPQEGWDEE